MRIYRIADSRHPLWDGTGALLMGGRWNSPGRLLIYGATTYAGAMLEILVHARIGKIPKNQFCIVAEVPENVRVEHLDFEQLPTGWNAPESRHARKIGDQWLNEQRSAILVVPSVVTGEAGNVLVNPVHPDASRISLAVPRRVVWDDRLFPLDKGHRP